MAKLEIITLPDPLLKQVSAPVEQVDDDLRKLLDDMLETMYDAPGIGLAGIQVAVPRRVLVIDIVKDEEQPPDAIIMVNPEILHLGDDIRSHEEGCLSIPDVYAEIERPTPIQVKYLDRDGKPHESRFDGLLATVIQHEVDHLDGRLFIDYMSRLKRDRIVKKFVKSLRADETAL